MEINADELLQEAGMMALQIRLMEKRIAALEAEIVRLNEAPTTKLAKPRQAS